MKARSISFSILCSMIKRDVLKEIDNSDTNTLNTKYHDLLLYGQFFFFECYASQFETIIDGANPFL